MILTKTIEDSDMSQIFSWTKMLEETATEFAKYNIRIDIGHPMRLWEYGMAFEALFRWGKKRKVQDLKIVDIGSGCGLLGPTFAYKFDKGIEEVEPDHMNFYQPRVMLNAQLRQLGKPEVKFWHSELKNFVAPNAYDVVYCISVIEHVKEETEFWKWLANLVKPGGLLFMTCDVVPERGRSYVFDNLRRTNYDVSMIKDRMKMLEDECGMKSFGEVDLKYNGDRVHNYSFASVCMVKKNENKSSHNVE